MKRKWIMVGLVLLLVLSLMPFSAYGETVPSIGLSLKGEDPSVDEEWKVTVQGEQLDDLFGFEIRLKYDASKVKFTKAAALWAGMSVPAKDQDGSVMFAHTKLGSTAKGENGSSVLAEFTFTGLVEGETEIEVERVKLVNSKAEAVTLTSGDSLVLNIGPYMGGAAFRDIRNHWAREAIEEAVAMGMVTGYPDGTFKPDGEVTRAEFTAMLMRVIDSSEVSGETLEFQDLASIPEWARPFIAAAVAERIVSGYEDGTFRSSNSITRAEMAVMITKAAALTQEVNVLAFADTGDIPDWAQSAVAAAVEAGLIQGKGGNRFEPLNNATRAEAVSLILRMVRLGG
jgi:hypothetical protein